MHLPSSSDNRVFSKINISDIKKHPRLKWYQHVILLGPIIGLLITIVLSQTLGCSEYSQYQSETCNIVEAFLGINLYWVLFNLYFIFSILCIITVPAALFVYIYRAITKRLAK